VIAEHALRTAARDQRLHQFDYAGTVGAAVAEVADEDQVTAVPMLPVGVIAKVLQQGAQCFEFAVYVADDIERTGASGSSTVMLIQTDTVTGS